MCRSAWSAGKGKVYGLQGFLTTRSTPLLVLCRPLLPSATRSIQSSAGHDAWPGSEVQTPQFGGGGSATEEHALDQCCGTATGLSTSVNSAFALSGSWRWLASASVLARSCLPSADRGTGRYTRTRSPIETIGKGYTLWVELWQHRRRSNFRGNDERVFCHPEHGSVYRAEKFVDALALALKTAGVEGRVRAFHDLRHTAITNDAAAGANPTALMTKAGHSDMKTTKLYLHLAGVVLPRRCRAA